MSKSKIIKLFTVHTLLISIFIVVSLFNISGSYADGVVPQSSVEAFPNLDTRLIGMPIKKTELTAALVAYSNAEAELSSMTKNQNTLLEQAVALEPELVTATENLLERQAQLLELQNALNTLAINQYQRSSDAYQESNENIIDTQRRDSQSDQVFRFLKKKLDKTSARVDAAQDYKTKIENTLADIGKKIKSISSEMIAKQKDVNAKKKIVGSTLPVASLDAFDIPVLTMDAYLRAEKTISINQASCQIPWWLIAGIGRAESNHGRFGGASMSDNGTVTPSIIGVPLNGQGFAAIPDTDDGFYDGDIEWDRAVGVMQFIPGTWNRWKGDGNGDGLFDPQNIYDGALATAQYLCSSAPNLSTEEFRRQAVFAYNHSTAYVDFVLAKGHEYEATGGGILNLAPVIAAPADTAVVSEVPPT